MHTRKSALTAAALAAGLALIAGGCYLGQQGTRYAAAAGGPPQAASPGAARMQSLGFGGSGGLFMPNDLNLAGGFMWDIHASLWLSPYLAVQADFGRCVMADGGTLGGQMTASPLTVSAIVSVPMPAYGGMPGYGMPGPVVGFGGGDYYRLCFGAGVGTMALSHTYYTDVPASISVVYVTTGVEWAIGFGDRFFTLADVYISGDPVEATQPSACKWDFTNVLTARAGIEIGF